MKNSEPDFINQRLWERGLLSPGVNVRDLSDDKISEMKLDYRDFITLKQCFSGDETSLNEIRSYNIDPQATSFMDALRLHEQRSSEIIRGMNIKDAAVVAELAGSHHHYLKETDERFQPAKEVLRVSVAASELVHLADVYQAVRQRRPYSQKKYSHIEALHLIMQETKKGVFQPDIAKRWMSRALPNIDQVSKEDHQKYEELKQFLETKAVGVSSAI